ncbi:hypothetical protein DPMN_105221 [Dreissena polymorpha]|uniref:Uncharacterized protein n=1 Tax=Dreissena polymorpha TaxID=45954 RepID=A0A9D4K381_DREPO|nr:hypothetical protein DPMN_105221 [Dreissena polymorpha]
MVDTDFCKKKRKGCLMIWMKKQMRKNTNIVTYNSTRMGLKINRGKSKVLKTGTSKETPISQSRGAGKAGQL